MLNKKNFRINVIQEIDSTQKVFIQFDEDYCFKNSDYYLLSYGRFKDFVIPYGFPFSYPYDMGFIDNENGLILTLTQKNFKLQAILKLVEYGLLNKDYITENLKYNTHPDYRILIKSLDVNEVDSIIMHTNSITTQGILNERIPFKFSSDILTTTGIDIFLQSDSIQFIDKKGNELAKIPSLYLLKFDSISYGLFIFDSNNSFYFLTKNLKNKDKKYKLSFSIGCLDGISIKYLDDMNGYKLKLTDNFNFGENNSDWDFFSPDNDLIDKRE